MKNSILLALILVGCGALHAQIGMGQWRLHVSQTQAIDVETGNGMAIAAFPSGLLEFDQAANEKTLWTDVNGLSDVGITALGYDPDNQAFWIGYENGNLDKLTPIGVTNIPAIKLAQLQGAKKINHVLAHDGFVYVSFGLGITKINPTKNEVVDSYYPNLSTSPILQTCIVGDSIYALTSKQVYRGYLNNIALANPSAWIVDQRFGHAGAANFQDLILFNNQLFLTKIDPSYGKDSVFRLENHTLNAVLSENDREIRKIKSVNNQLALVLEDGILLYDTDLAFDLVANEYTFASGVRPQSIAWLNGRYYIADRAHGLVEFLFNTNNLSRNVPGPPRNSFFTLAGEMDRIGVTSGVLSYVGFTYNPNGAYVFQDETWTHFDLGSQAMWVGKPVWDINSIAFNGNSETELAFGSHSMLPVALSTDGKNITHTFDETNSTLEKSILGNDNILVSDLEYDADGNLWVLNGYANKTLHVRTPDGLWKGFDLGVAAKLKHTERMAIDYNGNKWFYVRNTGLFGFSDNGTIDDVSDDKVILLNSNETTGALPSSNVTAIAVDFDNEIWIGTDMGFAILYNSEGAFTAGPGQYNAQRIKLDFEGNVEYLLGNIYVTDIEVDGGNRKWIASANSGLFLLSADGLEILQHITTENSALISNNILDIQFNNKTGELFIVTDKGLVSFRADATYQDETYSDVQVFPNPVRPEYQGPITIQGIRYDSDVKVTDAAGNLVFQTTSNGGTATWNGKNLQGEDVKSGVYLFWTATNSSENKGRKIGKVLIIR